MYSYNTRIGYSDCGADNKLKLNVLVNLFQNCSTFEGEATGVGVKELMSKGRGWLLASWQIMIERLPNQSENVEVTTEAYEFKGFYGKRNFYMKDENKNVLAYADSIWFYYDIKNHHPVKYEYKEGEGFRLSAGYPMKKAGRKIILPTDFNDECIKGERFRIKKSALDTNGHTNNSEYIKFAADYLPDIPVREFPEVKMIRVEYKQAAHLGDTVVPKYYFTKDNHKIYVSLDDEEDKCYAIVEFCDKDGLEELEK